MQRHDMERSLSWPSILYIPTATDSDPHKEAEPRSAGPLPTNHTLEPFEEDLENNPQNYFLSPLDMYEYEDWAEDSDSDGEEVPWNAGITDFALFHEDQRKAQESGQPLPRKWDTMLVEEAEALKRSIDRTRKDSCSPSESTSKPTSENEVPGLTPDTSPELRDDLDVESFHGQTALRPSVPSFLTLTTLPRNGEKQQTAESDEKTLLPVSIAVSRQPFRAEGNRKLQRPGMKYSRTMSGHVHAWRRPSWMIYPVGEDAEGEDRAERGGAGGHDPEDGDDRGRRQFSHTRETGL